MTGKPSPHESHTPESDSADLCNRTVTEYINQSKIIHSNGAMEPWQDLCDGHDTFYEAIMCRELQSGLENDTLKPVTAIMVLAQAVLRAQKITCRHRIVKRVMSITEEIVESAETPTAEKDPSP